VRIAVATCADEIDPDSDLLLGALAGLGLAGELCDWNDSDVNWEGYDLTVVRSTWDYASRRDEFLAWARGVSRLANPYPILEYSSDKRYLFDLATRGYGVVASRVARVGEEPEFPAGDFVVKPCVGAGSIDADRYGAGEVERARAHVAALHERGRDVLIQPYVASVDEVGETALIFIGGEFSHAMNKAAMLNEPAATRDRNYREERMSRTEAPIAARALAEEVLAEVEAELATSAVDALVPALTYGRVDVVETEAGWAVMELELVEPSLFLRYEDAAAAKLAAAILRRAIALTAH
jgi:glutathione synthase/RimK-type ligase-like ATP-grasp enzyme